MRPMAPLMLFDLDNTLVDRDRAFRGWAAAFLAERSLPPAELDWLTALDLGGYRDRQTLLHAAIARYGLLEDVDLLLQELRDTVLDLIECPRPHLEALAAARAAGWTLGIVTNGATKHQLTKIERTGLADLVDGVVVSEEAGCAKPDPRIFQLAALRCGVAAYEADSGWTRGCWMVGDHPPADIAGAGAAGLRSVWLGHGRRWPEIDYTPTLVAEGLPEAVALIIDAPDTSGQHQSTALPCAPVRPS
jgi:HAD superfamily hydrolase (TIGR01549 family)